MSKMLYRGLGLALALALPAVTLAQSGYDYNDYNDYNYDYNSYDYNYDYNSDYDSGASAALGIGFMLMFGVLALIGLAFFIFEIVMIVDCVKRQFENRTVWLVVLIAGLFFGFGWIASVIYYFTVKRKNLGGGAKPAVPAQK